MMLLKKLYDELVANENNIDTNAFVLNTKYQTDKIELEKKIPDVSSLATKTTLTALENKMPSVSSLVKKSHKNYWNWTETYWS